MEKELSEQKKYFIYFGFYSKHKIIADSNVLIDGITETVTGCLPKF